MDGTAGIKVGYSTDECIYRKLRIRKTPLSVALRGVLWRKTDASET
jgi:hypothetical protein